MRKYFSYILLLFLVAIIGCAAQGPKNELLANEPLTDSEEISSSDQRTAKQSRVKGVEYAGAVKLLDPGSEPRRELRYKFLPGKKYTMVMDMEMVLGMQVDDEQMPVQKQPKIRQIFKVYCKNVSPEGNLRYEFKYGIVEVIGEPEIPPEKVTALRADMAKIEGTSGWVIVSPQGVTIDFGVNIPPGVDPEDRQVLDKISQQIMMNISFPFPEEPVGVGAKWQFITQIPGLFEFVHVSTATLVELKDNTGKMNSSVEQKARPKTVGLPNTPSGANTTLESLKVAGSSSLVFDLTKPICEVEGVLNTLMEYFIEAEGEKHNVIMDTNVRMKTKYKD